MPTSEAFTASNTAPFSKGELLRALRQVLSTRTAPGLDGVRPKGLTGWKTQNALCRRLHDHLSRHRYEFFASKRGHLSRPGKAPRLHAISTMDDAVVLRAVCNGLEGVWTLLPEAVMGGRPGGSCHRAIRTVSRYAAQGEAWALRFDVKGAFSNASFDQSLNLLSGLTKRADLVQLLRAWRQTQGERFNGLVEGSPVAPLLLAVLLAVKVVPFLQEVADEVVVWLDDGVVLARSINTITKVKQVLVERLGAVGLQVHPAKTGVFMLEPMGPYMSELEFLGFSWVGWLLVPSLRAQQALLDDLAVLEAQGEAKQIPNRVRSWGGYFCPRNSAMALHLLADLDSEIFARHGHHGIRIPQLTRLAASSAAARGPYSPRAGVAMKPGSSRWTERTTYGRVGQ